MYIITTDRLQVLRALRENWSRFVTYRRPFNDQTQNDQWPVISVFACA